MSSLSFVQPDRRLAFPFVVALYSLLWFVIRDASIVASEYSSVEVLPRTLTLATLAVVLSYTVAIGVTTALNVESRPESKWMQLLFAPSNAALTTFATFSLALGIYIVLEPALPPWLQTAAMLGGIVLGWPLIAVVVGTIAVENALGGQQLLGVEFAATGIGVALAVTWIFLLSGWIVATFVPSLDVWLSPSE